MNANDEIYGVSPIEVATNLVEGTPKLAGQQSIVRVFVDDIAYLMTRIEQGSLASIPEHYEIQEEIHEVQKILADWDASVSLGIAKIAARNAVVTEQGVNELARAIEQRIVSRMKYGHDPKIENGGTKP